jgi:hypothetical protein
MNFMNCVEAVAIAIDLFFETPIVFWGDLWLMGRARRGLLAY